MLRLLRRLLRVMFIGLRKAIVRDIRACVSTQLFVIIASVFAVVVIVRQMQGPMDFVIKEKVHRDNNMFATMAPQETELEGTVLYHSSSF